MKDYNNNLTHNNNNNNNCENALIDESSPTSASSPQSIGGNPSTSNTTRSTDDDSHQRPSLFFDYVDPREDLSCPICLHPFIDPITHSCGNTFCSACVQNVTKCPMCSKDDFKNNCSPSALMIRNMLDKLKVKCDMCKNIVLRGELKDHKEKYCPLHDAYKQVDELKLKLEAEFNQKNEQLKREYFVLIQQLKAEKEQSIKDAKESLILKERELILKVNSSEEELEKRIQEFDKKVLVVEKLENSNKPIHLNVRGTIMTVALGDFIHNEREPDNLFKKMFTGEYPLHKTSSKKFDDPIYFIDCKPLIFEHILEWLKFGSTPIELSVDMKNSLLNSSKMFTLNNLSKKLDDTTNSSTGKLKLSQLDFIHLNHSGLKLTWIDLRSLVLQNTNLEKSEIISSDFSGMNLTQAKFKGSILRGCSFSNCDLSNADFNGCDLSDCDLSNAILNNTDMSNTNLSRASFEYAKLEKTKLQSCKFEQTLGLNGSKLISLDFTKSSFIECNMNGCNLTSSNLSGGVTFKNCDLSDSILTKANFTNSKFELSSLKSTTRKQSGDGGVDQQVNFTGSEFNGCNFLNKQFSNSIFKNCKLSECNLENTTLKNTDMSSSTFSNVSFEKSQLEETKFLQCKFEKAKGLNGMKLLSLDFSKSTFIECSFKDSDLTNSNFSNTTLSNCNLENTILKKSNFDSSQFINVKFNSDCIFVDCNLSGCNLSNQDLRGLQFKNVNFSNSFLDGSKFENVTFDKCSMKLHFKKNMFLKDCKIIDCNWNGSTFEEIDYNIIESLFVTTSFNQCTFQKCDLTLLKDLSKFKGNRFNECLFNFEQFTNKTIENVQFTNIDFNSHFSHLSNFDFKNVQYHNCTWNYRPLIALPSSNIVNVNSLISCAVITYINRPLHHQSLYVTRDNQSIPPQLLYRGSRDGFKAIDFHSRCDNQGPTLTIIKSSEPHNQIFGGFTTQSWISSAAWSTDHSAFLFKIDENNQLRVFNIKQDQKQCAIYSNPSNLPIFGSGDISISDNCNLNNSGSNFGRTYELPPFNKNEAGSHQFKVSEIEVFKIDKRYCGFPQY